jgi:hypothetical protein
MKNLVWLASYPRSGNTWFRIVLSYLLSENRIKTDLNHLETGLIANSRIMFDELAGINSSDLTRGEINNLRPTVYQLLSDESDESIYMKTHEKYFLNELGMPVFPAENTFGCIYFIRNPLDVAVSNAFYFNRDIDLIINLMNSRTYTLNSSSVSLVPILEENTDTWSEHVKSWMNSGLNVHFIRYEDMISQPFQAFSKALSFLGLQFPDSTILKAISDASFEKLKKSEETSGFKEKLQSCSTFFRNGKSGNWRTELTGNQIAKIVSDHHEVMQLFGYLNNDNKIVV